MNQQPPALSPLKYRPEIASAEYYCLRPRFPRAFRSAAFRRFDYVHTDMSGDESGVRFGERAWQGPICPVVPKFLTFAHEFRDRQRRRPRQPQTVAWKW